MSETAVTKHLTADFIASLNTLLAQLDLNDAKEKELKQLLTQKEGTINSLGEKSDQASSVIGLIVQICEIVFGENFIREAGAIQQQVAKSWTQTCHLPAAGIITPQSSKDVSKTLRILTTGHVPFAIRSGGHCPNPGFSSVDGSGILIDLSALSQVSISEDKKIASVGPGADWGKVVDFLDEHDVTVLGARSPQIGVGGLLLGGGISHFTPEYGFACDMLVKAEVVLADGSVITASHTEHTDLFRALKGGGPNFGIVSRFYLSTVPIKNIWYESNAYAPDQAHAILDAFAKFQEQDDPKAALIISLRTQVGIVAFVYSAPEEKPKAFDMFYDIPVLAPGVPATLGTVKQLSAITGALSATPPARHDYRAASSKLDAGLYREVYDFWLAKATPICAETGAEATFVPQHIPKSIVERSKKNGGNAMGLEEIDQHWWTSIMTWNDPAHDDLVRGIGIETTQKWEELSKARGSHLPFLYMNDASRDQNPLATYSNESLEKLKEVAKKYDPEGVFQKLQQGGFLLSKVP
ncbi:hypothetical protein BDV96DRAFT_640484 [Lophiotrema nucula]|uniref:FAD-binding PCMH-type domain-containing protein n=1 Tax=Lophiotrema nucula TaxID=690887 RepID=A0A6A5ZQ12_9PLEO|nr:hypothetical protein BDV96DRAFT_640484 [Lophiotrema nucula]